MAFILEQTTERLLVLRTTSDKTGIHVETHDPKQTFESYQAMGQFCVDLLLEYSEVMSNRHLEDGTPPT